jgi:hypothetical protein
MNRADTVTSGSLFIERNARSDTLTASRKNPPRRARVSAAVMVAEGLLRLLVAT